MQYHLVLLACTAFLGAVETDPAAAVVATGVQTYRVRDLDALIAIAKRQSGNTIAAADEDRLRQAIMAALTAREPLLGALAGLPMSGAARDRFMLDLLDYRAEPTAAATVEAAPSVLPAPSGEVVIALPALSLPRTIDGVVWVLQAEFALRFPDEAAAQRAQVLAPALRDAILDYLQGLSAAAFTIPDRVVVKRDLGKIIAKLSPGAAAEPLLIPALSAAVR